MKAPHRRTFAWFDFVQFVTEDWENGPWTCVGDDYEEEGFSGYPSLEEAEAAAEAYFKDNEIKDRTGFAILEENRRIVKPYWGKEAKSGGKD